MTAFDPNIYGIKHLYTNDYGLNINEDPFIHPNPRIPAIYAWLCICRLFVIAFDRRRDDYIERNPLYTDWEHEVCNLHKSLRALHDTVNIDKGDGVVECDACEFARAVLLLVNNGMVDSYEHALRETVADTNEATLSGIALDLVPLFESPFSTGGELLAAKFLPDEHLDITDKLESPRKRIGWLNETKNSGAGTGGNINVSANAEATAIGINANMNSNVNNNHLEQYSNNPSSANVGPITINNSPLDLNALAEMRKYDAEIFRMAHEAREQAAPVDKKNIRDIPDDEATTTIKELFDEFGISESKISELMKMNGVPRSRESNNPKTPYRYHRAKARDVMTEYKNQRNAR